MMRPVLVRCRRGAPDGVPLTSLTSALQLLDQPVDVDDAGLELLDDPVELGPGLGVAQSGHVCCRRTGLGAASLASTCCHHCFFPSSCCLSMLPPVPPAWPAPSAVTTEPTSPSDSWVTRREPGPRPETERSTAPDPSRVTE